MQCVNEMHEVPIQQGLDQIHSRNPGAHSVGVEQFACLDVVILYGGREDNVPTRVRSSQVLLICTRPAVFSAAERTFAWHGWTLLCRSRGSDSV